MGLSDFSYTPYPVEFWDVYGKKGLPVRTTVSEMGPELLARLLGLNETQSGILRIVFRIADDKGGFGYDPLFFYEPMGLSFSEMSAEQKNSISHRGKAIELFAEHLKQLQ